MLDSVDEILLSNHCSESYVTANAAMTSIKLYKVVVTFDSVEECGYSNDSYKAVLYHKRRL